MQRTLLTAAALFAFASAAHAATTNLVLDGDFTQLSKGVGQIGTKHPVADWTSGGYNFVFTKADKGPKGSVTLWDKANGGKIGNNGWDGLTASGVGNFAALDGDYHTGAISQTVNGLKVGSHYVLSFNYAFGQQKGFTGATIQSLKASIGSNAWTSSDFNVASHGFTGWRTEALHFTATNTSELLSFLAKGNRQVPPFALVSTVSIPSVPEPATWAMMILGVAGMGAMARRRRSAAVAA